MQRQEHTTSENPRTATAERRSGSRRTIGSGDEASQHPGNHAAARAAGSRLARGSSASPPVSSSVSLKRTMRTPTGRSAVRRPSLRNQRLAGGSRTSIRLIEDLVMAIFNFGFVRGKCPWSRAQRHPACRQQGHRRPGEKCGYPIRCRRAASKNSFNTYCCINSSTSPEVVASHAVRTSPAGRRAKE